MGELKLKKQTIYIVIAVIVTLILTSAFFIYFPKYQLNKEINTYKKAMYGGVLCQYDCPLIPQTTNNATQLLPDKICIQVCTAKFQQLNINGAKYSNEELQNDNFIKDIGDGVGNCRTKAANLTTLKIDNPAFFNCTVDFLESLPQNYSYLN